MGNSLSISQLLAGDAAQSLERLDAQVLLLHALGKGDANRSWLLAHDRDEVPASVINHYRALAQRRAGGEPVAYITGHKEFFGLDLQVDARVLVPRPDTETLVEWALAVLDLGIARGGIISLGAGSGDDVLDLDAGRGDDVLDLGTGSGDVVLDLGTGSGAVALALKHARPEVRVYATDFSADALAVAQANAQRLKLDVHFSHSAWLCGVKGRCHLIVSNPPYIATQDPHLAALTYEPLLALTSGDDGLDDIRCIIKQAPAHLHPQGWLLLEHGYDQAAFVRALLTAAGFNEVQSRLDLSGIARCSGGRAG